MNEDLVDFVADTLSEMSYYDAFVRFMSFLICYCGVVESMSKVTRLIEEGSLRIDRKSLYRDSFSIDKIKDIRKSINELGTVEFQIGKRKFYKLKFPTDCGDIDV